MPALLEVKNLTTTFSTGAGTIRAVDDVSFSIESGQTLGLVGESGCGKSVTALSILRLIPSPPGRIIAGEIYLDGLELLSLPEPRMKRIRGNRISMIFQEPMTSLNPVFTVGEQVGEVYRLHQGLSRKQALERVIDLFGHVGIPAPAARVLSYPHQLSGGMRQRVMIAMALACRPALMIADEPTTALDVTIQAQILDLMNRLGEETGASTLFITHDLGIIAEVARHVAVMYAGRLMEYAGVDDLYHDPLHPYTRGLLSSVPAPGAGKRTPRLSTIPGTVPSPINPPPGCPFHDRCPDAFQPCPELLPSLYNRGNGRLVRCFKYA